MTSSFSVSLICVAWVFLGTSSVVNNGVHVMHIVINFDPPTRPRRRQFGTLQAGRSGGGMD
jgi:hypothetical protein